jgi:hypothetical protein
VLHVYPTNLYNLKTDARLDTSDNWICAREIYRQQSEKKTCWGHMIMTASVWLWLLLLPEILKHREFWNFAPRDLSGTR